MVKSFDSDRIGLALLPRFGLEDFVCFLEGLPLGFCGLGFVLAGKGGKSCSHGDSGRSRLWVVRAHIIAVFGAIGLTEVLLVIGAGSCDRLWEKVCADENDSIGYYVAIVRTFLREENRLGSYPSIRVLINNNSTGWINPNISQISRT